MQPSALNMANLMAVPDIYPFQVNWAQSSIMMMGVTEDFYKDAPFLDQRATSQEAFARLPKQWVPLQQTAQQALSAPHSPMGWIFHVGHCGSTLLSRALALNPRILSLREPLPLRDLSNFWLERNEPWAAASPEGLKNRILTLRALWSRTWQENQRAVVKATSFCAPLAKPLLAENTGDLALMLAVSPEVYIASISSVPAYLMDLRATVKTRMMATQEITKSKMPALYKLTDGELAALCYISDITAMHQGALAAPKRACTLDFDMFLSDVPNELKRLSSFFGHPMEGAAAELHAQDPIFERYSKAGEYQFSSDERNERLAAARKSHSEEIKKGLTWLTTFASQKEEAANALEWFGYAL